MCDANLEDETIPLFQIANQSSNQNYNSSSHDEVIVQASSLKSGSFSLYQEAKTLMSIALPTVILQLSTFFIFTQCASAVGRHMDDEYLAAFSLGSLSGNITCISFIIGTLNACETLQPRAFGLKRYREVGLLAIRGFIMCLISLSIPLFLLLTRSDVIFDKLGQNEDVAHLATQWIKVYIWSVPAALLFRVTQRYLACQSIVMPCVFGAVIGCFAVHPFVLKWAIQKFGFMGSAWALVITLYVQFFLSLAYLFTTGSYEKPTMPRLTMKSITDALDFGEMLAFAKLSVGGIFALSEWWFWECICFMAGQFGLVEFCVHSITYQLIPVLFMIPMGFSIGLTVRMGVLLQINVSGAKRLAACTVIFTTILGIAVSSAIYKYQTWIVSIFTSDEAVFDGCKKIWFNMCIYNLFLWMFCVNRGILSALGLQWRTATNMFVVLWCFTIPVVMNTCHTKGYYYLWNILPLAYVALNIGLTITYATADWKEIGARIKLDKIQVKDAQRA